ncbi:MAG: DUF1802 family protein [Capsulimonadaceae bacterium]|nr:DUF1802 family protein [Capsulimonadaceae bacterium]
MLPETLQIALKEWALVQRALLEGRQIVLLRKGGLIEDTGEFDLKARSFLLMPTYIHETERAGDVQPRFHEWLRDEEARRPAENRVRFEAACDVTGIVQVANREPLKALSGEHVWTDQFIDGRFDWEPYKPVFALFCRAYRLAAPVEVPFDSDYAGCRSWIELRESVSTAGALPAIARDAAYDDRVANIRAKLLC